MPGLRVATLLLVAFGLAVDVGAATFTANNFNDLNDTNPGDGVCNVGDGSCSFRAAVQEANALAGQDTIVLAAGTHNLTQTYNCGGPTCGLFVEVRLDVEITGEGVGVSFLQGADINYQGAVIQVVAPVGATGPVRFSDLSMDPGTFSGFGGDYSNQMMIWANNNCPSCPLVLERLELNVHHTSAAGGSHPLSFNGIGPVELRDSTLNVSGGATSSPAGIGAFNGVHLLIEDFTMNGGNSASAGVSYTAHSSGPNSLTIRRSRFAALGSSGDAAIALNNINIPVEMQVLIEDSEFVGGARGVKIRNWGTQPQTTHLTIDRSLFTGASAQALLLAGPCNVTLRNSTISSAPTGVALTAPENGGTGACAVALDSTTIAGGTTSVAIGSGLGTISARNSILADASSAACTGTLDSLGHNLIEGSCTVAGDTTGNLTGVDPMLAALADNGGPTRTRALAPGSPAIDTGDAANCPPLDQRGFSRPADGDGDLTAVCDMGAFEKDAVAPPSNQPPVAQGDSVDVLEDGSVTIDVAANDSDPDGNLDPGTTNTLCDDCAEPSHGVLANNGDGSFDYAPTDDYFGADSFSYEICDDLGLCDRATVTITVMPVNDAPSFLPGPAQVFPGGSSGAQSIVAWASLIDLGPGEAGQSMLGFAVTPVADPDGVVTVLPSVDNDGDLSFALSGNAGTASFTVVLQDDGGVANGGVDTSAPMPLNVAVGTSADVAVEIEQCSTQAPPDERYDYAMRIDNGGPDAALDVVLEAPLPAGTSVDALGNANCMDAGSSVTCHFVQIAAGGSVAVPVGLLMPGGGPATLNLEATIDAATEDPNSTNDSAGATLRLSPGLVLESGFESCDGLAD